MHDIYFEDQSLLPSLHYDQSGVSEVDWLAGISAQSKARWERSYELYDAAHSVAVDATRFTPRLEAVCRTLAEYVPMYAYKRNYMLVYDLAMGASA